MYAQVPFIELVYTCSLNTLWCFYCMCGIYLCGQKGLHLLPLVALATFHQVSLFCHNISLFHWYLAPSGVDNTYDLGDFSPGMDITVAGCHRLTLGAFVAILAAGVGVVVAPWHGHHAQHISAS